MIYEITLVRSDGSRHQAGSLAEAAAMLEAGWKFVSLRGYSVRKRRRRRPLAAENAALQINA